MDSLIFLVSRIKIPWPLVMVVLVWHDLGSHQSTRNSVEPRRTFCLANLQSFAGHLEFSPGISCENFSLDILSDEIKLLCRTFSKFARHVRLVRRISRSLSDNAFFFNHCPKCDSLERQLVSKTHSFHTVSMYQRIWSAVPWKDNWKRFTRIFRRKLKYR